MLTMISGPDSLANDPYSIEKEQDGKIPDSFIVHIFIGLSNFKHESKASKLN